MLFFQRSAVDSIFCGGRGASMIPPEGIALDLSEPINRAVILSAALRVLEHERKRAAETGSAWREARLAMLFKELSTLKSQLEREASG